MVSWTKHRKLDREVVIMDALKMVFAVILGFCAFAVALQYILTPLYADLGTAALYVWFYLDILMAVSLVIALGYQLQAKRAADARGSDGVALSRQRLEANALFYATVLVAIWFFRNWFDLLTSNPLGNQSVPTQFVWDLIDGLLPIVLVITARRLWRSSAPAGQTAAE